MSEQPRHLLHTLSDEDWQLVVAGLRRMKKTRASELAEQLHAWRLEVHEARTRFWQAFRDAH